MTTSRIAAQQPSTATPHGLSVLDDLRRTAETTPVLARRLGWDYLRELGQAGRFDQLAALFADGSAPAGPDGPMEGLIIGKLFGIPETYLANPLMKIDPTWRGKTFDIASGTGFNRLSPLGRFSLRAVAPLYTGLRRAGRETIGFAFRHRIDTAAIAPFIQVRALDYGVEEYRNPAVRTFPIKRTRDEVVELTPGLYLGRALLTLPSGEIRLIAYFGLREFSDEKAARA